MIYNEKLLEVLLSCKALNLLVGVNLGRLVVMVVVVVVDVVVVVEVDVAVLILVDDCIVVYLKGKKPKFPQVLF